MKIKNNSKNLRFIKQTNINYSINEFFSLDMFNPILKKNYFNSYDLGIFKNKKFRTCVLATLLLIKKHPKLEKCPKN